MSTTAKPLTTWTSQPGRTGIAWISFNSLRLFRQLCAHAFTCFISFLGAMSSPGMKPVGVLQAWALRRMGVRCASSDVWVGSHVCFEYPWNVVLGRRVVIGSDSRITARSEVVIGDDFLSAPGLYLNTGTHDIATLVPQTSPITIGPGVWCGTRVTVGAGVAVGEGAVIGAGSVVLKDIPPWHLAFGVPCKPQRALPGRPPSACWSNFRAKNAG